MKKFLKIAFVSMFMMIALSITGCYTTGFNVTKNMNSWIGLHISYAIQKSGPVIRTSSDGNGGKIYTWVLEWETYAYYDYFGVYQPPKTLRCIKSFYANKEGIIYNWHLSGNCGV